MVSKKIETEKKRAKAVSQKMFKMIDFFTKIGYNCSINYR